MALKDWSETAADNDDADATINWLEGQAPSTVNGSARSMMAIIKKSLGHIVSAKDVGAVGDGSTDDTAAILDACSFASASKHVLYIPGGQYKITDDLDLTAYPNLVIVGDGYAATPSSDLGTEIIQHTNNRQILRVSGRPIIENISLRYNTQQSLSSSDSYGIEINNVSGGSIRNVRVYRARISFGIPQTGFAATGHNFMFNHCMESVESWEASHTHFDLRNFNAGGTNCKLGPVYINGGGSLDFVTTGQSCAYGIRTNGFSGLEVGAVSMDGLEFTERLWDSSNDEAEVETIRSEAAKCKKDNDGWFGFGGSYSKVHIGHFNIMGCRALLADVPTATYLLRTNATTNVFNVDSIRIPTNANSSYTAPIFRAATVGSTNGHVRVGPISEGTTVLTDRIWTGSAFAGIVRVWDGRIVLDTLQADRSTSSARRIPAVSASLPTGTTTGDRSTIVNPGDIGRPVEYVDVGGTLYPSMFVGGQFTSTTNGDADLTLTPRTSRAVVYFLTTLTQDRTVTLSTTNAQNGTAFLVVRPAGGAFNLNVGTGPLKALPASSWGLFVHDGTNYRLAMYGSL